MDIYTDEHWQELIETIIDRIGVAKFFSLLIIILTKSKYYDVPYSLDYINTTLVQTFKED